MADWGNNDVAANGDAGTEHGGVNGAEAKMANGHDETAAAKAAEKAEQLQKARDAGWTEKTAFDYDQFMRVGGDNADWHASSRVYEWSGE